LSPPTHAQTPTLEDTFDWTSEAQLLSPKGRKAVGHGAAVNPPANQATAPHPLL